MADVKPWFYTIRKHRKKTIAAAIFAGWLMNYGVNKYREYMIRRELCLEAKAFGESTLPSLKKPRRLLVFFNPSAGSGSADSLFKKNAEPILHIAALDVTIVKTDYEGQIKTLTQYIDPNVDGIIVAGGDGTLLEVITGLLRRSDEERISRIPIGLIPLGTHNFFCDKIFSSKNVVQARQIGNAALAIVKGITKPVDAIEIKSSEGRSTFALSKLQWGAFRDATESEDKYWMVGPFRRKISYLIAAIKDWPPLLHTMVSYPIGESSENTVTMDFMPMNQRVTLQAMAKTSFEGASEIKQHFSTNQNSTTDGWITIPVQTFGLSVETVQFGSSQDNSFLKVQIWPSDYTRSEFITAGWKMEKMEKEKDSEEEETQRQKCLVVNQVKLEPKDDKVSWFSIDGEPFEAKPITLRLLPRKLQFFCGSEQ